VNDPDHHAAAQERSHGTWSPLRGTRFRRVWFAGALSLSCYWMTEAACAWQMRILSGADPFLVSLVTATMQFTVMAAVMPAGVIADIVDRRRLILVSHAWMAAMLGVMSGLLAADALTPWLLLAFLPLLALAQAIRMPVIGSLLVETVDRQDLGAAVALNALGQNGSRIVGPAIAGALIGIGGALAALSLAAVVLLIAGAVLATVVADERRRSSSLSWRRFVDDAREERSFLARASWKRNLLLRLGCFFACASAIPALLPVEFSSGGLYGLMLALYGVGAFGSLLLLGRPRSSATIERRAGLAQLGHAVGLIAIGATSSAWLTAAALLLCGGSWFAVSNSMMTAAQLQLPAAARGRGLSVVYAVGMAGLAFGGPVWGYLARHFGIDAGFACAGLVSIGLLALTHRRSVTTAGAFDGTR
jgi:MFS family permease